MCRPPTFESREPIERVTRDHREALGQRVNLHLFALAIGAAALFWPAGYGRLEGAEIKPAADAPRPRPPEESVKLFA